MGVSAAAMFRGLGDVRHIVKAATETVNNSDVLQDDDALFFSIAANEAWSLVFHLRTQQDNAAADYKMTITAPVGCAGVFMRSIQDGTTPGTAFGTQHTISNSSTTEVPVEFRGVAVNGGTAGSVMLRWAQSVATAADSKVLANSYLIATRLS